MTSAIDNDTVFTPLLTTTDWNEEWKQLQTAREHFDDPAVWDERAKTFPVKHGSQHGYAERFLELAALKPGETVLDMGCGTGALATPLAQKGHPVVACDFSQGMLRVMEDDLASLGVSNVDIHVMSWDDNWNEHGIGENSVDVAFASRSIATYDLRQALEKLTRAARRRVCITLPASLSPKSDDKLLAAAGFENGIGRDFLYAFNILAAMGASPEVSYIPNTRLEVFDSFEDAVEGFTTIVRGAVNGLATPEQMDDIPRRLRPWLQENGVEDETGFHLKEPRNVTWAFLAWNR